MIHFSKMTLSELYRMFARPRTYIGFGAFVVFDTVFLILMNLPGPQRFYQRLLEGSGYLFDTYFSGLTLGFLIVLVTAVFFSTIYLALVAGDIVAKDQEDGNLRLILSRPISRLQLLLSKFVAVQCYTLLFFGFIGLSSYITGALFRGWGGGLFVYSQAADLFSIFGYGEGLQRYFTSVFFLGLTMTTVSSVAFLFSCQRIKPAAATILTISFFFIDAIIAQLPFVEDYRDWFLLPRMQSWLGIMREPIPWATMIQNYAFLAGISATCFILGWISFERRDLKA